MQIYSDGKNRVIKGTFPKRFRLLNAGAEVPYLRTAKDAIRLSGELPIGLLDIEEVEQKKTAQPAKLDAASLAIINKGDFDRIDILNKKLAINQEQMNSQLSALTEHEATIANLETQNAQAIEDTKNSIVEMAVAVGKEIQADREALKQTAESFSSSLKDTGEILSLKIEAHEKAKNPHNISKATIGLERVDNTPDIDKPVSKPVKKELDKKADKKQVDELSKKIEETGKKQDKIVKGLDRINWVGGVGGNELPTGGKEGQFLAKGSDKTGDYKWVTPDPSIEIVRVDELPATGETNILYLVPVDDPETKNIYDEYIWAVQSDDTYGWEKLGTTEVDLSGYVPTSRTINSKALTSDITLSASDVGALPDNTFIPTDTSDLTNGAGFITPSALSDYVTLSTSQKINAAKAIFGTDVAFGTDTTQKNLLAVISNSNSLAGNWIGRLTVGAKNKTFIMGTYGGICVLGAHAWTDAQKGTGAAWEPVYINPDGNKAVYIGGSPINGKQCILKIQNVNANTTGTVQINRSTNLTNNFKDVACWDDNVSKFTNDAGYITGISSTDVTDALGYTPYDSNNPAGYTSNVGTVTSVNNVQPVSGNVTLSIPTVNNATLTIQKNGTSVGTFTANASSNVTANITVPTDLGDLTNNAGYTKNVGTVTSVNNVSPVSGNVSLTIPTITIRRWS